MVNDSYFDFSLVEARYNIFLSLVIIYKHIPPFQKQSLKILTFQKLTYNSHCVPEQFSGWLGKFLFFPTLYFSIILQLDLDWFHQCLLISHPKLEGTGNFGAMPCCFFNYFDVLLLHLIAHEYSYKERSTKASVSMEQSPWHQVLSLMFKLMWDLFV